MGYSGSPGSPIEYLFIDGASLSGYLRNLSEKYFDGQVFEIDLSRYNHSYLKIFYYDAFPTQEPKEPDDAYRSRSSPQEALFKRLRETDHVHVYEGDARRRRRRGLEQKMVDVMLAVDMLTHSFRRNMQRATLLTGDQDFKPLLDALVLEGMLVTLLYPMGETNPELIAASDRRRAITLHDLSEMITRDSKARFNIPIIENQDPKVPFGETLHEWVDEIYGICSIARRDDLWAITRANGEHNRLTIFHTKWPLVVMRAEEHGIHVPNEFRDVGDPIGP